MNDADRFDHWIDPTPTRLTTGCGYRRLRGPSGVGERRLRLRAVNGRLHETKTCARGASVTWALVIGVWVTRALRPRRCRRRRAARARRRRGEVRSRTAARPTAPATAAVRPSTLAGPGSTPLPTTGRIGAVAGRQVRSRTRPDDSEVRAAGMKAGDRSEQDAKATVDWQRDWQPVPAIRRPWRPSRGCR